jgi:hypothetical protein
VRSFLVNSVDKLAVHVELKLSGSCIADRLIIALRKSGFPAPVETLRRATRENPVSVARNGPSVARIAVQSLAAPIARNFS